jgi:hypothetical protein
MYKLILTVLVISFVICSPIFAETRYKYAGEFLNVGAGARALGMGGAFVAVADDATAAYWSPGGLSSLKSKEVTFMYSQQFDSFVKTNFIGYAHPTSRRGTFSISWLRLGVEDIPKTGFVDANGNLMQDFNDKDNDGVKDPDELYIERPVIVGTFNDVENGVFLSYGFKPNKHFSAGVNLKIIRQSLSIHSASGFGFDVGILSELFSGFKIGFNLQDVPKTTITWDLTGNKDIIPASVRFGVAYTGQIPSLKSVAIFSWSMDTKYGTTMHYGTEWWLMKALALRLGLDDGRLSAGAGLRIAEFQVDYAFIGHDDIGNTHRISTSVRF